MRSRWFLGAAAWGACYLALYLLVIRSESDGPAWWYLAVLLCGVALSAGAAFARPPTATALGSLALVSWTGAALVGLLSIGVVLIPAAVLTGIGLGRTTARVDARRPPAH